MLVVDNEAADRGASLTAVCVVSLENVGRITSLHGSEAAGVAASEYAARLEALLRSDDQLIAINESKHCLLLRGLSDRNHAMLAGAKLERLFETPLEFRSGRVGLKICAGFACGTRSAADAEELFRAAEAARDMARTRGVVYEVADEIEVSTLHRRWKLNEEVESAVREYRIRAYYQPQICTRHYRIAGAEALVRWEHEGVILAPGQFLPFLDTERMRTVTIQMIRQAIRDLAGNQWMPPVSLNLEPYMLGESSILRSILDELTVWDVEPERLVVEVTERGLMSSLKELCPEFAELRNRGVRVSMDDFGTGQSSLGQFKNLPLDEVKIDRSFVRDIASDEADQYLARVMVELGHFFGLTVVGEGVETAAAAAMLERLGCDRLQGFLYAPPLPLDEFSRWEPALLPPRPA